MHIHYFLHIMHIMHIMTFLFFAGHKDCMVIFKSAAYYDLSDEDLEEILSCYNEPVLRPYIPGVWLLITSFH